MEDEKLSNLIASNQSSVNERDSLLGSSKELKPYARRWYVLILFSYAGLLQAMVWNTFGPIAQSSKLVFNWTDADIGMLANYGNIVQSLVLIPMAWVLDVKGLRVAMVFCCTFLMAGIAIKCISTDPVIATWLINIGCVLNGIGGSVPFAAPALFSATWFGPNQRATSTAISSVANYVGIAVAFIIGPLVVPEPTMTSENTTTIISLNESIQVANRTFDNLTLASDIQAQRDSIMHLMYIECGAVGLLFLLVLLYFPAKPPSPPSITASIQRVSYKQGLKEIITHKRFLLILLTYSVPVGVYGVFGAVLDVLLAKINISQNTAGWIGFYATLAGCGSALFVSRIADMFMRRMRIILLLLFILATAVTAWFVVLLLGYIPFDMVSLYISAILTGVFINGSIPLFYELGCEAAYPIAEGITTSFIGVTNNVTGIMFLSVLQIPHIGVTWMNWALLGSVGVAIPLLLVMKENYSRMNIDTTTEIIIPAPEVSQSQAQPTVNHTVYDNSPTQYDSNQS